MKLEFAMSNLENTERGLNFLDKALSIVNKYRIRTILKGILIILLVAATIGFIQNPTYIFEKYKEWEDNQHKEQLELRLTNTNKINHLLEKALYRLDVDRIILLECHNGNSGNGGLPFAKCTATFEVLNDDTYPIANQYQEVNLSLMPFAAHLFQNGYWCGNTEDLKQIDKGLYHKMAGNGTEHFAACVIEGVDTPLAFLFVSFKGIDETHDCELIRDNIRHLSLELALLLELGKNYK